jgi:phytoene dehydrogenase-like protein
MTAKKVGIVGTGMGSLSAAAILTKRDIPVEMFEQNWLPGGCASSYPRKHVIYESGATTLVGAGKGMPLQKVLDITGIEIPLIQLQTPMKVILKDGTTITRHADPEAWISEAEKIFGTKGQRSFWNECIKISRFVWRASGRYTAFPFSKVTDILTTATCTRFQDIPYLRYSFISVQDLLKKHGLDRNEEFIEFCNEQLIISAQNHCHDVNALFGATALCYTNVPNYYVPGGMIEMVKAFTKFIEDHGGIIRLRTGVESIRRDGNSYLFQTEGGTYQFPYVIGGIPINNLYTISDIHLQKPLKQSLMLPENLYSAFTMGISLRTASTDECIHTQIHIPEDLLPFGSGSLFISRSAPGDSLRTEANKQVLSVSTHIRNPHIQAPIDKTEAENRVISYLHDKKILNRDDIEYYHSSQQKSWLKWTARAYGSVGGYPQQMHIKPWQMKDARWDQKGAYLCGDTVYPGQGIPGVALSGFLATEKMRRDHGI